MSINRPFPATRIGLLAVLLALPMPVSVHAEYDAVNGRFLQRDPAGYAGEMNLYEALKSNPLRFLDPSGEIPLDTLLDAAFLTFDIATGAGAATVAMDVAALLLPYVPNGGAIRAIGSVQFSAVKEARLRAIERIDTEVVEDIFKTNFHTGRRQLETANKLPISSGGVAEFRTEREIFEAAKADALALNKASVKLEYVGWHTMNPYAKHFKHRGRSLNELKSIAGRGEDSIWRDGITDGEVRQWIDDALAEKQTLATFGGSGGPRFKDLDGLTYDTDATRVLERSLSGRTTTQQKWVGVSNGKCTSVIKLKLERDGTIHAYPWAE